MKTASNSVSEKHRNLRKYASLGKYGGEERPYRKPFRHITATRLERLDRERTGRTRTAPRTGQDKGQRQDKGRTEQNKTKAQSPLESHISYSKPTNSRRSCSEPVVVRHYSYQPTASARTSNRTVHTLGTPLNLPHSWSMKL